MKCDKFLQSPIATRSVLQQCKSVVRDISNSTVKNASTYSSRNGKNVIVEVDTAELYELMPTHILDDNDKGFYKVEKHTINNELTSKFNLKIYDHKKCGYYHIDKDGFFKMDISSQ